MRLIIHIGTEKTGTTSIQEFLRSNRSYLAASGIGHLRMAGERNQRKLSIYSMNDDNIDNFIRQLDIASPSSRQKWRYSFKDAVNEQLNSEQINWHSVVVSCEQLHSRLRTFEEVDRLRDLMAPYFDEIKIIVYLRRQDLLATSLYSTHCTSGGTRKEILDPSIIASNTYYNYYNLIDRWGAVFGIQNVIVRKFDKEHWHSHCLFTDFVVATRLHEHVMQSKLIIPEKQNESISATVQQALLIVNREFPWFIDDCEQKLNRKVQLRVRDNLSKLYTGPGRMPTQLEAQDFQEIFTDPNLSLEKLLGMSSRLFSDDYSMYPVTERKTEWHDEIVSILIRSIGLACQSV